MKTIISYALAVALLLVVPSMSLAKDKGDKPFHGKVTAIDTTANTITVGKKKSDETKTFKTTGATITVDGAPAKLTDITVGMHAKVTVGSTPDTATEIDASTHKKGGKKDKTAA